MNYKKSKLYLSAIILATFTLLTNCSTESDNSPIKSYEGYANGEYHYTLEFTDFLRNDNAFIATNETDADSDLSNLDNKPDLRDSLDKDNFKHVGQCHYALKSTTKLDLNDPLALKKAYADAVSLGENQKFMPLPQKIELLRTDIKLREIFSEKINWFVTLVGSVVVAGGSVMAVDTVLHETNTAIVKRGVAYARHPKVKASKYNDIVEALIAAAKAEQTVDEIVMTVAQAGSDSNPLRKLARSKFATGLAKRVPKVCKGGMALGCVAGYTALLAGLGLAGTKGGFMVTEQLAKPIYSERDKKTLESMYAQMDSSSKVTVAQPEHLYRLNSRIVKANFDLETRDCPSASEISHFYDSLSQSH